MSNLKLVVYTSHIRIHWTWQVFHKNVKKCHKQSIINNIKVKSIDMLFEWQNQFYEDCKDLTNYRASKMTRVHVLHCVWLFVTPWTAAHQAPLSMEFPRKKYWSGLLFPSPGDLPDPGIKPVSLASLELAGRFFTTAPLGKPNISISKRFVTVVFKIGYWFSQWHRFLGKGQE